MIKIILLRLTIFKILVQFTPVELLQAIHDDWNLFIDQYGPAALFQALHDAKLDLSQIIRRVYNYYFISKISFRSAKSTQISLLKNCYNSSTHYIN